MTIAVAEPTVALGTYVELAVTDRDALAEAERMLAATVSELDRACSRFRADSELSKANSRPGRRCGAGRTLRAAVRAALEAAEATGGLVDPTLGAELVAAGYDRDFSLLPRPGTPREPVQPPRVRRSRWRDVEVDDDRECITVPRGCQLDLGATAKALGSDTAAGLISDRLDVGVLVSLGGDVASAGPLPVGGWAVRTGTVPGAADIETVLLEGGALATSSPDVRTWQGGSTVMHHIFDPRTGRPCRVLWSAVTVAAPSCVEANTLTTAAVIAAEEAPEMLAAAGLPARLVSVGGVVLRLGGWPEPTEWSR